LRWLRGVDLNHRPLGYEPNELPDCSTPHEKNNTARDVEFARWNFGCGIEGTNFLRRE
jgi:hypothetical protein